MVRIHSEHYGRGPRKAKTFINGNVIICVLEDGFTQVEKTLNTAGLHEHVRRTRHLFQSAVRESFTGGTRPDPEKFELLAMNDLGEPSNATPAISDGQIFLRTDRHLYCIAED